MNAHKPRKRFAQHFLKDRHVLHEMTRFLALHEHDNVVEIGPGLGALTEYLLPCVSHLNVIELDRDLISHLEKLKNHAKLSIFSADALNFSYADLSKNDGDLRVVGNLPYNISTPLLFKLFSEIHCIRDMHFMLQKEVVLRLTAEIGSADYGRLSVMSQYFCDNEYLMTVGSDAFDPPPKVESAIVRLTPQKTQPLSPQQFAVFSEVVKEAFNYRRKQLRNGLRRMISAEKLEALDINPSLRPQDVSLLEFIRVSEAISVE